MKCMILPKNLYVENGKLNKAGTEKKRSKELLRISQAIKLVSHINLLKIVASCLKWVPAWNQCLVKMLERLTVNIRHA